MLGGDGINGQIVDGRFFLASHGQLTEVGKWTFFATRYLAILTIGTFIPMVLGSMLIKEIEKRSNSS